MPETSPKAKPHALQTYWRMLGYVRTQWRWFALSMTGFSLLATTQPMYALILERTVDTMQKEDLREIGWLPLALVGVTALRGVTTFLGTYCIARFTNEIVHTLRYQLFDQYTRLPISFFDKNASGHLVSYVSFHVNQIASAAGETLKIWLREGLTLLGLLAYLFYQQWKLSLVLVLLGPLIAYCFSKANKKLKGLSHEMQTGMAVMTQMTTEVAQGIRTIKSFNGEKSERDRFLNTSQGILNALMAFVMRTTAYSPLMQIMVAIALSLMIVAAQLLMTQSTPGEFVAYFAAAVMLPRSLRQMADIMGLAERGLAAAETVFEVLDLPPEPDQGTTHLGRAQGKIELRNVSFRYTGQEQYALQDITLTINPGQTVAIVGASGSGKTTLASLIMRFYDVEKGAIFVDGVDIRDYVLADLRRNIAYITQFVTLFDGTVEKNIAYGAADGKASPEAIWEAARLAHALEFIEKLPKGMQTLIGENGLKLSGGQRQRIALARAFLKDAPILLLDEATSALDNQSERKIQAALEAVRKNRTTIIIAHRLSTIENADMIVVMDHGRIVETGTHHELIHHGQGYNRLYSAAG